MQLRTLVVIFYLQALSIGTTTPSSIPTLLTAKAFADLQEQHHYLRRHKDLQGKDGRRLNCLDAFGLSPQMASATASVLKGVAISDLYVAFEAEGDYCLLEGLWDKGLVTKVTTASRWKEIVEAMPYQHTTQHLLVGTLTWIVSILDQVRQLFQKGSFNSHKTKWLWLVTEKTTTDEESLNNGLSTTSTSFPSSISNTDNVSTFSHITMKMSPYMEESFNGIVLLEEERTPTVSLPIPKNSQGVLTSWVTVGSIDRKSRQIVPAATWTEGGFRVSKPLWPELIYDFHERVINISCLKKASVTDFEEGAVRLTEIKGYLAEIMKILMNGLNLKGNLVPAQGGGSKNQDGKWNGIVGVLTREEAEIGALDFTPSLSRSQVVDFGIPFGEDPTIILSNAPIILVKPFLLLQIFSREVWGCLVGLVFIGGLVLWGIGRCEAELNLGRTSYKALLPQPKGSNFGLLAIPSFVMMVFKILVLQSIGRYPQCSSGRLLTGLIMLVALIFGSLYNGSITAFLVIPFKSKPINSVSDLLNSDVIPAVRSKTNVQTYTVNQEGGALHSAKDKVAVVSGSEAATPDFHDKMAKGTLALVDVYSAAMGRANRFTKRGEKCKFHVSRDNVQVNPDALAFRRNSPYLRQFDFLIRSLQYFGIIDYVKRKHVMVLCEAEISREGPEPMSLLQAQGPLIVLGVGLGLATVILILELGIKNF